MNKNEFIIAEKIFLSVQGEGPSIGHPTIFVRVFACNMKPVCPWCDTMYAVKTEGTHFKMTVEDVVNTIISLKCEDVTFTGGEPTMYIDQIKEVIKLLTLTSDNYKFHFETNGLKWPGDIENCDVDYTISPKFHAINLEDDRDAYVGMIRKWVMVERNPIYFKFVYEGPETIDKIKKLQKLVLLADKCIYLMPEGKTVNIDTYQKCAQACIDNNFIMSPRLHVVIWGNKRGV